MLRIEKGSLNTPLEELPFKIQDFNDFSLKHPDAPSQRSDRGRMGMLSRLEGGLPVSRTGRTRSFNLPDIGKLFLLGPNSRTGRNPARGAAIRRKDRNTTGKGRGYA